MLATTGVGDRKLIVLLDSDAAGSNAADRVTRDLFADDSSRVMLLAPALGLERATIEDIVPRTAYVAALAECGHKITLNAEELKAGTTMEAVEKSFARHGLGKFSKDHKAAVVLKLIDGWGKNATTSTSKSLIRCSQIQLER